MNGRIHQTGTLLRYGLFVILAVLPLVLGLGYALTYSLGLTGLLSEGFTLAYWAKVLSSGEVWWSVGLSFYAAVVTMSLSIGLALLAVLYWRERVLRGRFSFAWYLPLVLPAMVVAFLVFQWLGKGGFFSRLAFQMGWTDGLQAFPTLMNDPYGIGIIVAHTLMAMPFFVILFANIYQSEQLGVLGASAATLGASRRQIRWRITVPVILLRARATLLLYGIFVMSSYEVPLLLGRQSPQMVSVLVVRKLQRYNLADIPQAYVISIVYAGVVFGLLSLGLRAFPRSSRTLKHLS
ncbi:MAG: hypothetical protein KDC54_12570 [Lewinella sp.]|nr:hypothetical protein [Lewinella sp.]